MPNKTKRKFLCGCTVITRMVRKRKKLSIYPACDLSDCQVKRMVQTSSVSDYKNFIQSNPKPLRLPQSKVKRIA